ncbi:hypothetical protein GCM10027521_45360 [Amycolatopsis cihanbeyliensis]
MARPLSALLDPASGPRLITVSRVCDAGVFAAHVRVFAPHAPELAVRAPELAVRVGELAVRLTRRGHPAYCGGGRIG